MDREVCLILGQVSLRLLLLSEKPPEGYMRSGETDKTASDIQARSFMARNLERISKKCQAVGKS